MGNSGSLLDHSPSYAVEVSGVEREGKRLDDLKSECEEFCKQIRFNDLFRPSDGEREMVNQDAVRRIAAAYPHSNVVLVHTHHSQNFQNCAHVKLRLSSTFYDETFHVYIFLHEEFTLHGDGGLINLCCNGNFRQDDRKYTFYDR